MGTRVVTGVLSTKFSFYFFTPLSSIGNLSCPPLFLGRKYKNSKFCDFLVLHNINQLVNNFVLKIINFQSLAFNGLIDDGSEYRKAKGTKKCIIKRKVEFEDYENCLEEA